MNIRSLDMKVGGCYISIYITLQRKLQIVVVLDRLVITIIVMINELKIITVKKYYLVILNLGFEIKNMGIT